MVSDHWRCSLAYPKFRSPCTRTRVVQSELQVKVVLAVWMPLYHVRYGAQTHLAERDDERTRRRAGSLLSSRSAAEGIRVNIAPLARIAASWNSLSPHEAPVPAA